MKSCQKNSNSTSEQERKLLQNSVTLRLKMPRNFLWNVNIYSTTTTNKGSFLALLRNKARKVRAKNKNVRNLFSAPGKENNNASKSWPCLIPRRCVINECNLESFTPPASMFLSRVLEVLLVIVFSLFSFSFVYGK